MTITGHLLRIKLLKSAILHNSLTQTSTTTRSAMDLASLTFVRPAEIKTYHKETYPRISPSKTLNGKGKTLLITGGGMLLEQHMCQTHTDNL